MLLVWFYICAWLCRAGVCWSVIGGPVWNRPLREKRNRLFIRRRGGPMWPPAMEGSPFVGRGLPDAPHKSAGRPVSGPYEKKGRLLCPP